jgi:ATP-dependent Lhr-like helicase
MPYAFLDDAPLEERRARAVALRRALPDDARDLGRLDPQAVRTAAEDAWPRPRDAEELHDALLGLVLLPLETLAAGFPPEAASWSDGLEAAGRVMRLTAPGPAAGVDRNDATHLAAAERIDAARAALAGSAEPVKAVVRGWAEMSGPFRSEEMARTLGLPAPTVEAAAAALEQEGVLLRGAFTSPEDGSSAPDGAAAEWCDRRILARIHRATLQTLRREIEPVSPAVFLRFLAAWQHAAPSSGGRGRDGLLQAIEILEGFEAPIEAWESALLPARVERYDPDDLEALALGGAVVWGRFAAREPQEENAPRRATLTRSSTVSLALRDDLPWLVERQTKVPLLSSRARALYDVLAERGASFPADLAIALRLLPAELDAAVGELVARGLATLDGFAALRRLAGLTPSRAAAARAAGRFVRRRGPRVAGGEGRVALLDRSGPAPEDRTREMAAMLLRRWGVLFRDLLAREGVAPPWRALLPELRRAEARGEVRGGRFVDGVVGEQFALAEAVEALRAARRGGGDERPHEIAASDPLNLTGILLPGRRIPAVARGRLLLRDGLPFGAAG